MVVVSFFVLGVYVLSASFVFSSHVFQDECKENKKLDQQILITPMVDIPPYFIIKRDRGTKAIVSFGGIAVDFLSWLAEYSHFQYLDPADPTEYEKYGVVPLLLKSLLKKDSDIIPFVTLNVGREIQYLDYSFPIAITNYRFMLPYPEEEQRNNISAIFLPMDAMVWLMIAMAMVGLVVYMSFYNRFYQHLNASESTMTNAIIRRILYAFGLFSGRSSSGNFFVLPYNSSLSIRFIVGLLALMTVILFNGYTTALTSFLTVQKLNPVVNSFQELASSKQYHLVAPLLSFMSTFFLNATTEPFKALGNSLRQNPHLLITKFPESLTQKLLEYNGVYAHVEPEIQGRIGYDMKLHKGQCRFTASNPLELAMPYYTVLRKGDPFVPTINEGTIRIWEFGLAQYWISSYVPSIDKCLIQDKQTLKDELRRWKPLTLEQLSGSFLLLVMGVLFALLIFILELLWNKLWG